MQGWIERDIHILECVCFVLDREWGGTLTFSRIIM